LQTEINFGDADPELKAHVVVQDVQAKKKKKLVQLQGHEDANPPEDACNPHRSLQHAREGRGEKGSQVGPRLRDLVMRSHR